MNQDPIYRHGGIIRSIRVSLGEKAMQFSVGGDITKLRLTVSRITQDVHDSVRFGIKRYNVFVRKWDDKDVEMLWKSYDNMPCVVEYDINTTEIPS